MLSHGGSFVLFGKDCCGGGPGAGGPRTGRTADGVWPLEEQRVVNPFWSEKAKEEAQLRAMRPRDLPVEEPEGGPLALCDAGAQLPEGGGNYGRVESAGGVPRELFDMMKGLIAQNQHMAAELKAEGDEGADQRRC